MSQSTSARRSQRSNRRLPARFLDAAVEVLQVVPLQREESSPRQESQGNENATTRKTNKSTSSQDSSPTERSNSNESKKRAPKVKCKTDVGRKLPRSKNVQSVRTRSEPMECSACGRAFSSLSSLRRHEQAGSCRWKLDEQGDQEEEVDIEAGEKVHVPKDDAKKRESMCTVCHKNFVDKYTLKVHQRIHTGERPFHCTLCEKKFTQRSALQFHLETHDGQKHECSICGYKFTQARSLKRHMLFHSGHKEMKKKMVNRNYRRIRVPVEVVGGEDYQFMGEKERAFIEVYECEYCKKLFKRVAELTVHIRVHTNERPFECKTCGKCFKQLCHLNGHRSTHHKYVCEECERQFTTAKDLQQHQALDGCANKHVGTADDGEELGPDMMIEQNIVAEMMEQEIEPDNPGESTFRTNDNSACRALENLAENLELEESHTDLDRIHDVATDVLTCDNSGETVDQKNDHSECQKRFRCKICNKKFRLLSYLKDHVKTHSQEKPYVCENCNKRFKTLKCLQNHAGRNSCTGIRPYTCEVCGKSFMYSRYLGTHRCHNTPDKVYQCTVCDRTYRRRDRLLEHLRIHTGERPYACQTCGKTFAKIANFRLHQRVHTGEKKYECKHCGKKFAHNSTLRYHVGTHGAEKAYPCNECQKVFPRLKSLLAHVQSVHNLQADQGKTSYLCSNCGKVYHHLKRLLRHFCAPNGVKQHKCDTCGKGFDRGKQLEIHMRVHTGEKPYECKKCGKRFTQSGGLNDHMLSHTREKKFQCDLCDVRFLRMKSLKKHKLIIHTGVEPHICGQCGATFKYYKAFKKHELLHGQQADPEQKTLTDILVDIEQAINDASPQVEQQDQAVVEVVDSMDQVVRIDHSDMVNGLVIHEDPAHPGQQIIISQTEDGHVLHLIQDPQQVEIDQSIQEIQVETEMEEAQADELLVAVVASVGHHEEVISAP